MKFITTLLSVSYRITKMTNKKNILTDGNIRAGEECPFWANCKLRTTNCPSVENNNLREHPFSCGAARLFVIIEEMKENA